MTEKHPAVMEGHVISVVRRGGAFLSEHAVNVHTHIKYKANKAFKKFDETNKKKFFF